MDARCILYFQRNAFRLMLTQALLFCSAIVAVENVRAEESASGKGYSVENFKQMLRLQSNIDELGDRAFAHQQVVRRVVQTPLGTVALRWPATLYSTPSFSPVVTVTKAWTAAAKILEDRQFPAEIRNADFDWNVLFVNGVRGLLRSSQKNSDYYHLAWMGPPADIVIDISRSPLPSEQELVRAMVHEIGHAVEYRMMGEAFFRRQRWHSEGFATWFESYLDATVSGVEAGGNQRQALDRARWMFRTNWKPYLFQDRPADYAQSFALISTLAACGNNQRLFSIYQRMSNERISFEAAVGRELHWDLQAWTAEAAAFLAASDSKTIEPSTADAKQSSAAYCERANSDS